MVYKQSCVVFCYNDAEIICISVVDLFACALLVAFVQIYPLFKFTLNICSLLYTSTIARWYCRQALHLKHHCFRIIESQDSKFNHTRLSKMQDLHHDSIMLIILQLAMLLKKCCSYFAVSCFKPTKMLPESMSSISRLWTLIQLQ